MGYSLSRIFSERFVDANEQVWRKAVTLFGRFGSEFTNSHVHLVFGFVAVLEYAPIASDKIGLFDCERETKRFLYET